MNQAISRFNQVVEFVRTIMQPGKDFGAVPGTDKPTLLKPGAEKLTTFFGLTKRFEIVERVEDWIGAQHNGEPFFYYLYRCALFRGDVLIAESDGSANSFESKYRWRWVKEDTLPSNVSKAGLVCKRSSVTEFEFAINKAETSGKYGKPAEYWQRFKAAIENGSAHKSQRPTSSGKEYPVWTIEATAYRIPNDDIASQVNTLQKMAQKRALIAATLLAVNASEFFTQDLEDLTIEGEFSVMPPIATETTAVATAIASNGAGYDAEILAKAERLKYTDASLLEWLKNRFKLAATLTTVAAALEKLTDGQKSQAVDDFTAQLESAV